MMHECCRSIRSLVRFCSLLCGVLYATQIAAQTTLPPGTSLFVLDSGPVMVQFVGGTSALLDNELHLDSPANSLGPIFHNHSTTRLTTANLGTFAGGSELIFRDEVSSGDVFFSGPGSRNADGLVHARIMSFTNAQVTFVEGALRLPPGTLLRGTGSNPVFLVGFEDNFAINPPDFNDMRFLVNNVTAVPEPSQFVLLLAGLALLGGLSGRRRP